MMSELKDLGGKNIVLGVTGSIAAYKSADLIRRLKEQGAEVRVVMTNGATEFITPLTLQSLSGHPVAIELLDADQESAMGHIALARWADWVLVAPASADFMAKVVHGRADDLLSALILATTSPVVMAPAMNNKMWSNAATQDNLTILKQRGIYIIGPATGDQACGEQGDGRLVEPVDIVSELARLVVPGPLEGKRVVITAGPTYEAIDPVRFIGNRSSGKMGYALASAAKEAGAEVLLISGPVALHTPVDVNRVDVESAEQMYQAVLAEINNSDIFVSCAAVSDFRPKSTAEHKIKKMGHTSLSLELEPTTDIVAEVVRQKKPSLYVVGFAAETQEVSSYAKEKRQRKGLDMIAANLVGDGIGFASDNNALEVFWAGGERSLPSAPKTVLARDLIKLITEQFYAKNTT